MTAVPVIEMQPVFGPGAALPATDLAAMFQANGPYWNQGRYLSAAGAASQMPGGGASTVGVPWYRQDWAIGSKPLVAGAQELLDHPGFADAAKSVFGGRVVRPHTLYANVQMPATSTDMGHTDVPEFRGMTRDKYPVALLHLMNRSGLFARWQLDICTAVTWVWDGPRGDFVLWSSGPGNPPIRYPPPLSNRAIVSDNDRMFHAVGAFESPTGPPSASLTPTSEVFATGDGFALRDGEMVIGRWPSTAVRCSLSWKAYVFADEAAAQTYDGHTDDLDPAQVYRVFAENLEGLPSGASVTDEDVLRLLTARWPKLVPVPH